MFDNVPAAPLALATVASDAANEPSFDEGFGLAGSSTPELARLLEQNAHEMRVRETRQLRLAVGWADAHDADPDQPYSPLVERPCLHGGAGTPEVEEFCVAECATLQGLSYSSGRALLADALDVRYRLPQLWRQVLAGDVRGWKARGVADATRQLSWEAAAEVDHAISGVIETVPWPRFQRILGAAVLEADPNLRLEREERARTERKVWASESEFGLKTLVARANAGDVTWFMAAVNRIADILKADGDTDAIDIRRAKAIGILAQPGVAVRMLAEHALDPDGAEEEADEPGASSDVETPAPEDLDLLDPDLMDNGLDLEPVEPEMPTPEPEDSEVAGMTFAPEPSEDPADIDDPRRTAELAHTSLDVNLPSWLRRVDPKSLRPRVVLYFHLSEAAIRDEYGLVRPSHGDALTLIQLRDWLTSTDTHVQVRPVIVPAETEPVDGYEIPSRIREAARLRHIAEVWPYGTCTSGTMDLDHTKPYLPMAKGGPLI